MVFKKFRGVLSWLASTLFLRWVLLLVVGVISWAALVFPIAIRPSAYPIVVGAVAQQDIQAPRDLSYQSELETQAARKRAEELVQPVYLPADPSITRRQIESMRLAFDYINTVRADAYSTPEQKAADLSALDSVILAQTDVEQILTLSDARWEIVRQESLGVLEQVMRNTIRETQLRDRRRDIPTLISFALSPDQASLVLNMVTQFVVPNSLLSEELTQSARLEAREAVQPITRSFVAGETIVQRGQVVTPVIWESLQEYGLIQPQRDTKSLIAASILILLILSFVVLYFGRRKNPLVLNLRSLLLIAVMFMVFLYLARLIIPNRIVIPYLYPIPAFGLVIAALFGPELSMVMALILSILAAYGQPNSLDLILFYILTSMCGILMLGRGRRVSNFFWSGMVIGAAGSAVIIAYRLPDEVTDWFGIATLIGSSFFNGMASASLSLLFQYFISQLLGMTTALQLLEISRPDHPLLQFLMRNAPGTYQHSLQVSNLAEQAAEAIGADALLVRVGALYHDSGKAMNPSFFIENQVPGSANPHDLLDPETSAATIIRHVTDGVALARRHRLPPRIKDFMLEHHGSLITRYQYAHAVEAAGGNPELVDENNFRYPGPPPQSKETALLMLADGCEARARAELPKDDEELHALVKRVIDFCQREGQLDNTALTLKDLNLASDSFVSTLRNTHHPRLKYPEIKTVPRNVPSGNSASDDQAQPSPTSIYQEPRNP